jgi:cytochrome c oxidase subunit II
MKRRLMLFLAFTAVFSAATGLNQATLAQATPRTVEVSASRYSFSPHEITLKKGQPVIFMVKSKDATHGLRFEELHQELTVNKGESAEMRFTPETTGDFIGHCTTFCGEGHGDMMFTIHVVE